MIKATRVGGAVRDFPVAGLVGSKQELDTLVRTVAIAGYNSVIRRIVRRHFESCDVCRLPVARQDGAQPPHLHEDCRAKFDETRSRRQNVRRRSSPSTPSSTVVRRSR